MENFITYENGIIEQFKTHAGAASFHYADDSTKEWGLAKKHVRECQRMLEDYPEYRDAFLTIAKKQLCAGEISNGYEGEKE